MLRVEIPDQPGGLLTAVAEPLAAAGINVEYVYAFADRPLEHAVVVLKVSDIDAAEKLIRQMSSFLGKTPDGRSDGARPAGSRRWTRLLPALPGRGRAWRPGCCGTTPGPGRTLSGRRTPWSLPPAPSTGTMAPTGNKYAVATRSPLTGFIGDSLSSGGWPLALKRAGYDALVVTGRAETPTYLFIDDDRVYFRTARRRCGAEAAGRRRSGSARELGDDSVRVATIGPAGERLVRYACIGQRLRPAGRPHRHRRRDGLQEAEGDRRPGEPGHSARRP